MDMLISMISKNKLRNMELKLLKGKQVVDLVDLLKLGVLNL